MAISAVVVWLARHPQRMGRSRLGHGPDLWCRTRFYNEGVFRGKRAMLSVTTGGPNEVYEKGGRNGDIHAILRPIQRGILEFVGFSILAPHIVYGPARKSDEERRSVLSGYS